MQRILVHLLPTVLGRNSTGCARSQGVISYATLHGPADGKPVRYQLEIFMALSYKCWDKSSKFSAPVGEREQVHGGLH